MNVKNYSWIISFSFFVLAIIFMLALLWFSQYEVVEGKIVNAGYTVSASETFVSDNGLHGTVELPENYYLMIEINGEISSYNVKFETYINALQGQTAVKLLCNPFSCHVIE